MKRLLCSSALLCVLVTAAPAGAVVGGAPVDPASVPWFVEVNGCGGSLVAPDRVVTAQHCVARVPLDELRVVAGGQLLPVEHLAMHPGWRHANGPDNVYDDIAIVELAQPVSGVAPVTLGRAAPREATILGSGRPVAPGGSASMQQRFDGTLRDATLRTISDAECARAFTRMRGNGGERFDGARMLCAVDVDGQAPLNSGCNGDSGGPLYSGPASAPVLHGIVSWGGAKCGADHSPSVFAEVARYRGFISDPSPVWAPSVVSPPRIAGTPRAGSTLTCSAQFAATPSKTTYSWARLGGRKPKTVGRGRTYEVAGSDAGHQLSCFVEASNDGGASASGALVKIKRS
jgi:secreted trypsin-like serine protease